MQQTPVTLNVDETDLRNFVQQQHQDSNGADVTVDVTPNKSYRQVSPKRSRPMRNSRQGESPNGQPSEATSTGTKQAVTSSQSNESTKGRKQARVQQVKDWWHNLTKPKETSPRSPAIQITPTTSSKKSKNESGNQTEFSFIRFDAASTALGFMLIEKLIMFLPPIATELLSLRVWLGIMLIGTLILNNVSSISPRTRFIFFTVLIGYGIRLFFTLT